MEIEGWRIFQPWAGGIDANTPEFCDIDADVDIDYFSGSYQNYFWFFENAGTQYNPNFQYISSTFDSIYPVCFGAAYWLDIDFCDIDDDGDYDALLCNGIIGLAINQGTSVARNFSSPPETLYTNTSQYLIATSVASHLY